MRVFLQLLPILFAAALRCHAWDYEGHRLVNLTALSLLPTNFPAWARTAEATERIGFLGGEMDRWRNTGHYPLRHANNPDHYLDLEDLEPLELSITNLPMFRFEFVAHLARVRLQHPDRFSPVPANDFERTRALPGFLPWLIAEQFARLKSSFSSLKAFDELGTPEEIANARANVVYTMGLMGHAIGDAAQPLHTTRSYNGWVGPNPNGYTTNRSFHSWIDGGYLRKVGMPEAEVRAASRPAKVLPLAAPGPQDDPVFRFACRYIADQFPNVEELYRMDKDGRLSGNGTKGLEGRDLLVRQLASAAGFLADLWMTALDQAPMDQFLRSQLVTRRDKGGGAAAKARQ